jgi:hypothetical protein
MRACKFCDSLMFHGSRFVWCKNDTCPTNTTYSSLITSLSLDDEIQWIYLPGEGTKVACTGGHN